VLATYYSKHVQAKSFRVRLLRFYERNIQFVFSLSHWSTLCRVGSAGLRGRQTGGMEERLPVGVLRGNVHKPNEACSRVAILLTYPMCEMSDH